MPNLILTIHRTHLDRVSQALEDYTDLTFMSDPDDDIEDSPDFIDLYFEGDPVEIAFELGNLAQWVAQQDANGAQPFDADDITATNPFDAEEDEPEEDH